MVYFILWTHIWSDDACHSILSLKLHCLVRDLDQLPDLFLNLIELLQLDLVRMRFLASCLSLLLPKHLLVLLVLLVLLLLLLVLLEPSILLAISPLLSVSILWGVLKPLVTLVVVSILLVLLLSILPVSERLLSLLSSLAVSLLSTVLLKMITMDSAHDLQVARFIAMFCFHTMSNMPCPYLY